MLLSDSTVPVRGLSKGGGTVVEGITANIAWYFFLAGAGSGTFMLCVAIGFAKNKNPLRQRAVSHATLPSFAPIVSVCLVLAGTLFLLTDLGVPELFPLAIRGLGHSVISFGVLSISLFVVLALLYATACLKATTRFGGLIAPILKWAAFAAAMATACYTGYYLFSIKNVTFWSTPLTVVLFLCSSLSTGAACLILLSFLEHPVKRRKALIELCSIDSILVMVETIVLAVFMGSRILGGGGSADMAHELILGSRAFVFWAGAACAGCIAPLVLERIYAKGAYEFCALVAAASVLTGGFALRCSIILI